MKKSLAQMIELPEQLPADFYDNSEKYEKQLLEVIETSKSLVHELSDEGRARAKKDAALIRKYAKTTDSFRLSVYRSLTEKAKIWSDRFSGKTKELAVCADDIMDRFEEMEKAKLDDIRGKLVTTIDEALGCVRNQFREYDIESMVKLSGTLTPKGELTAKAMASIHTIAIACKAAQDQHDKRIMVIENSCLRADINPPLTKAHCVSFFYAEDAIFCEMLDELIQVEVDRRAEMEAKLKRKIEADKQKEIDAAVLKQKQDAERLAREEKVLADKALEIEAAKTKQVADELNAVKVSRREAEVENMTLKEELEIKTIVEAGPDDLVAGNMVDIAVRFTVQLKKDITAVELRESFIKNMTDKQRQLMTSIEIIK